MEAVLEAVKDHHIYKEGILPLLEQVLVSGQRVEKLLPPLGSEKELEETIIQAVESLRDKKLRDDQSRMRVAMGLIMQKWRGRVSAAEVARQLNMYL